LPNPFNFSSPPLLQEMGQGVRKPESHATIP